jgi:hypothetical protein
VFLSGVPASAGTTACASTSHATQRCKRQKEKEEEKKKLQQEELQEKLQEKPDECAVDLDEQLWSQSFREMLRNNSRLQLKPLKEVSWDGFEEVRAYLRDKPESKKHAPALLNFLLGFLQDFNSRMAPDFLLFESASLFDARKAVKLKNRALARAYVIQLLFCLPFPDYTQAAILQATAVWYGLPDVDEWASYDAKRHESLTRYYGNLISAYPAVEPFCRLALHVLRIIPTVVPCETRNSTIKIVKNPQRNQFGVKTLQAAVLHRDEKPSAQVNFEALYAERKELERSTPALPKAKESRGIYKPRKS